MRKVIGYMFGVMAVIAGIAILGVGNSHEIGDIGAGAFAAYMAIFSATAGICGHMFRRFTDEQ